MSESTGTAVPEAGLRERVLRYLPRGNMLDDADWTRRHRLLLWVLGLHVPALVVFGLAMGWGPGVVAPIGGYLALVTAGGYLVTTRRAASLLVTLGLTSCSVVLVVFSHGSIEAHFHFFVIVGFLALYQDWFPFLWNIAFTVASHGLGSALVPDMIFSHHAGQGHPWLWSVIHGVSVLAACAGVLIFWRFSEDAQNQRTELAEKLAQAEIGKKQFTSELLLNLARRNQGMFHRQLDIINDLEEKEQDPDALAELFRLDHLATRVRRNAESLLVLSGEQPARVWSAPVPLRDVVRAAIAETEDLDRVVFTVDEHLAVQGSAVADLTHLLAELVENAVRFSPPTNPVTVTSRAHARSPGAHLVVVEDTGVGMPGEDVAAANELLATPQEVDVSASRRLGFHVVSRLADRHGVAVSLSPTPGCGVTAVIILPAALFATTERLVPGRPQPGAVPAAHPVARPAVDPGAVTAPAERVTVPRPGAGRDGRTGGAPSPDLTGAVPGARAPGLDGRHAWPGGEGFLPDRHIGSGAGSGGAAGNGHARPVAWTADAGTGRTPAHGMPEPPVVEQAEHVEHGEPGGPAADAPPTVVEAPVVTGPGLTPGDAAPVDAAPVAAPVDAAPTAGPVAGSAGAVGDGAGPEIPAPRRDDDPLSARPVRRGLIHPIVVPPPPAETPGGTGGPSPTATPATGGPGGGTGGGGRTLTRRVPQANLAPELARGAAGAAGGAAGAGPDPVATPPPASRTGGTLDALSRYQASRRMAHQEIGAEAGAEVGANGANGSSAPRAPGNGAS